MTDKHTEICSTLRVWEMQTKLQGDTTTHPLGWLKLRVLVGMQNGANIADSFLIYLSYGPTFPLLDIYAT